MILARLVCVFFWVVNITTSIKVSITRNPIDQFKLCLEKGKFDLGFNLILRGSGSRYRKLNFQWNKGIPKIYPFAFILPANDKQVTKIVKCGESTNIRLVQNGGGHSYTKASFGDSATIVIDLRKLNSISVDKSSQTGIVGAGVLLGPLFWSLWKNGKFTLPLGECPTVGIAFTLGGGYGPFSRQYGLTSDQLISANIVTADGKLLKVNKSKYPDLFWALRGGGLTSFGIVTKFKFRLHPAPSQVFVLKIDYKLNDFAKVFLSWQNIVSDSSVPNTLFIRFQVDDVVAVQIKDVSGNYSNIQNIEKRLPRPDAKKLSELTYPEFLIFQGKPTINPKKRLKKPEDLAKVTRAYSKVSYFKTKSFYVKNKITNAKAFNYLISNKPKDADIYTQTYLGAINNLQPNETAFIHRNGTLYNFVIESNATTKASFLKASKWIDEIYILGKTLSGSKETYQNYADNELVDYLQEYYGSNLQKLMEIKKKYDPQNYFHTPQSIPPALN